MGLIALRILSAGSTVRGLRALQAAIESRLGGAVDIATDHGHNIVVRMAQDEPPADAVLLPRDMIDTLTRGGRLAPDAVDLGFVATSAVVAAGAPAPAVGNMDALRSALLRARRVLLTTAPSGEHMTRLIEALGVAQNVAPKVLRFERSSDINAWLAREGDEEALGFGPTTEILGVNGVRHAGLVAPEAQMVLPYAAAVVPRIASKPAAQAFLAFLQGGEARTAFAATGVSF